MAHWACPYLFGIVAYHLKNVGHRWRHWAPLVVLTLFAVAVQLRHWNARIGLIGLSGAALVWYVAVSARLHPDIALVRCGDLSYGVYLLHVAVLRLFFDAAHNPRLDVTEARAVFGGVMVAVFVGAIYGHVEYATYFGCGRG
jgi:peptidoglycan/LPS O-acetylase OafA/YrhL